MRPLALNDPISGAGSAATKAEAIVQAIEVGVPKRMAAQAAGVSLSGFFQWQARGAALLDDPIPTAWTEHEAELAQFVDQLRKAEAKAVVYAVGMVRKAMPTNWQAAMTWLERRYPDDFARREAVRHDGEVTVTHEIEVNIDREILELEQQLGLAARQAEENGRPPAGLLAAGNGDEPRPAGP